MGDGLIWSPDEYMVKLKSIPNLMELVKNPFLLTLALRALPGVVEGEVNLAKVNVTRLSLYDSFVIQWLAVNQDRTASRTAILQRRSKGHSMNFLQRGLRQLPLIF